MLDVASGELINGAVATGFSNPRIGYTDGQDTDWVVEAINDAAAKCVETMVRYILPQAFVLHAVDANTVLLDKGSQDGIIEGMTMIVLRTGEQGEDQLVARVQVASVTETDSMATVVWQARGVKPEDRAKAIYEPPSDLRGTQTEAPRSDTMKRISSAKSVLFGVAGIIGLWFMFGKGGSVDELVPDVIAVAGAQPEVPSVDDIGNLIAWGNPEPVLTGNIEQFNIWRDYVGNYGDTGTTGVNTGNSGSSGSTGSGSTGTGSTGTTADMMPINLGYVRTASTRTVAATQGRHTARVLIPAATGTSGTGTSGTGTSGTGTSGTGTGSGPIISVGYTAGIPKIGLLGTFEHSTVDSPSAPILTGTAITPGIQHTYYVSCIYEQGVAGVSGSGSSSTVTNQTTPAWAGQCTMLTRPLPVSPGGSASQAVVNLNAVAFQWQGSKGADTYCIEIAPTTQFLRSQTLVINPPEMPTALDGTLLKWPSSGTANLFSTPANAYVYNTTYLASYITSNSNALLFWRVGAKNSSDLPGPYPAGDKITGGAALTGSNNTRYIYTGAIGIFSFLSSASTIVPPVNPTSASSAKSSSTGSSSTSSGRAKGVFRRTR
jgi:hypothetical protein